MIVCGVRSADGGALRGQKRHLPLPPRPCPRGHSAASIPFETEPALLPTSGRFIVVVDILEARVLDIAHIDVRRSRRRRGILRRSLVAGSDKRSKKALKKPEDVKYDCAKNEKPKKREQAAIPSSPDYSIPREPGWGGGFAEGGLRNPLHGVRNPIPWTSQSTKVLLCTERRNSYTPR